MQGKERVFQAITFELLAMALIVPTSALMMKQEASDMLVVSIGLSLFAMLWNYISIMVSVIKPYRYPDIRSWSVDFYFNLYRGL